MPIAIGTRFHTGQHNPVSGTFLFDGYMDGVPTPVPSAGEKRIPLSLAEVFPPCMRKACYWKLERYA